MRERDDLLQLSATVATVLNFHLSYTKHGIIFWPANKTWGLVVWQKRFPAHDGSPNHSRKEIGGRRGVAGWGRGGAWWEERGGVDVLAREWSRDIVGSDMMKYLPPSKSFTPSHISLSLVKGNWVIGATIFSAFDAAFLPPLIMKWLGFNTIIPPHHTLTSSL